MRILDEDSRSFVWSAALAVVLVAAAPHLALGAPAEGNEPAQVKLSPEQIEQAGIKTAVAGPGRVGESIQLPGEIRLNADNVAHITPRVPGVAVKVIKGLGDSVRAGETLAVLESKELADAKSAYLAAREHESLAKTTFAREKDLWEKKISAEQDYLEAKQGLAEAGIALRTATQQLRALGIAKEAIERLGGKGEDDLTRFEIAAPIDGTIIEKRIVLGESVVAETSVYVVANLGTVWADFSVSPQDMPRIEVGLDVTIASTVDTLTGTGAIAYVGPVLEQDTRAALARVILASPERKWKPGMFVSGAVEVNAQDAKICVPKTAVQLLGGAPHIFVKSDEGFAASPVTLGRSSDTNVEVLSGLEAGQTYAASGTFILKADVEKEKGGEE